MVGNLVIEEDSTFGGAHLQVLGPTFDSNEDERIYSLVVDNSGVRIQSPSNIELRAGSVSKINQAGGKIRLKH